MESGTNTIVGNNPQRIKAVFEDILTSGGKAGQIPEGWDGKASERICEVLSHAPLLRQ